MASDAVSTKKPKGALIAALVFLLLGIGGCGYAVARVVPFVGDLVDFVADLDQFGDVVPMGEETSFTANGTKGVALLSNEAVCTGDGPSGSVSFEAYEAFGTGTNVELNGQNIEGFILFDTETGADYTLRCGDATSGGSYIATTAPSFIVEGAPGFLGGIGAGFAGAFFVLLALILLIIGLVQRSSWKKKQARGATTAGYAAAPPVPGAQGYQQPGAGHPQQGVPPAPGSPWGSPQQPPTAPPPQPPPAPPQQPPPAPPQQQPPPAPPQQPPPPAQPGEGSAPGAPPPPPSQ